MHNIESESVNMSRNSINYDQSDLVDMEPCGNNLKRKYVSIDFCNSNNSSAQPHAKALRRTSPSRNNSVLPMCHNQMHNMHHTDHNEHEQQYLQPHHHSSADSSNHHHHQNQCEQIEYVNVMYDSRLLPDIQQNNAQISQPNFTNYNDEHWNNVDLLDLDQKNLFFQSHSSEAVGDGGGGSNNHDIISGDMIVTNNNNGPTDYVQNNKIKEKHEFYHNLQSTKKTVPSAYEDCDDKNLSWLFNYKLDELPHLSPEVNIRNRTETCQKLDEIIQEATAPEIEECDVMVVAENVVIENTLKLPKKPPFTYTELIEYALEDRGELTVSGIYQWISDRFPYYKSNDDRWKNSVRHNLSINPHFRKGIKASQGAGHLWTISTRDSDANILAWEHKKQRFDLFFKMEKLTNASCSPIRQVNSDSQSQIVYDEAAIAASNIPQMDRHKSLSPEPKHQQPSSTYDHTDADDLRRSAGEILNGVRRNVEVQVVHPTSCIFQTNSMLDPADYLNPVPKDQIVRESGLRSARNELDGNNFYVTEIDPIELGVNMNTDGDEEVLFGEDFNLNYFGIVSGSNILA